jgi:glycosyltransferase involved in cell wall biosynthesis
MQSEADTFQRSIYFATFQQIEPVSGSLARALASVEGLIARGYRVTHGYFKPGGNSGSLEQLRGKQPDFSWATVSLGEMLKHDILWLSNFWSPVTLIQTLRWVDEVRRRRPDMPIVVDLSDVLVAQGEGKEGIPIDVIAYLEGTLLRAADCIGLVSELEKKRAVTLYGLSPNKIVVIPTAHEIRKDLVNLPFSQRHPHVCMAGTTHRHNLRALGVAIAHIWPLIRQANPAAELHVFGMDTDKIDLATLGVGAAPPGVRLIGAVDDFQATLAQYRVHLVPTVSGVGVKTKLLDSLASGTPVVGTRKCLEGTELSPGHCGVYAENDPAMMARLSSRLLTDEMFWIDANRKAGQAAATNSGMSEIERQCKLAVEIAVGSRRQNSQGDKRAQPHVFAYSPCGRSSSTALQRVLNSSGQIRVYGETHGAVDTYLKLIGQVGSLQRGVRNLRIVPHMAKERQKLEQSFASGRHDAWYPNAMADWSQSNDLLTQSFDKLFPVHPDSGRFGFKEISVTDLQVLLDLSSHYHNAYMIFLFRNPIEQWQSIRSFGSEKYWPYANDLGAFTKEYQRLSEIYMQLHKLRPARTVFFENTQLREREQVKSLFEYLRLSRCDFNLLGDDVGTSNPDPASEDTISTIMSSPGWMAYQGMQKLSLTGPYRRPPAKQTG